MTMSMPQRPTISATSGEGSSRMQPSCFSPRASRCLSESVMPGLDAFEDERAVRRRGEAMRQRSLIAGAVVPRPGVLDGRELEHDDGVGSRAFEALDRAE